MFLFPRILWIPLLMVLIIIIPNEQYIPLLKKSYLFIFHLFWIILIKSSVIRVPAVSYDSVDEDSKEGGKFWKVNDCSSLSNSANEVLYYSVGNEFEVFLLSLSFLLFYFFFLFSFILFCFPFPLPFLLSFYLYTILISWLARL